MTTTFTYPTRTEAQSTTTALTAAVALAAAIAGAALLGTIGIRTGAPDRPVDQVTQPITYPSIPEPISPSVNPAPTPRFGGGSVAFRF